MSQFRATFVLRDGTALVFPFVKRMAQAGDQDINTALIASGKGWRIIAVAAWGPSTYTLERCPNDKERRLKCQTGDEPTTVLAINGHDGVIDRFFPGEGFMILLNRDNTLELVRDSNVIGTWQEIVKKSLGDKYGNRIGDVFVGGLFVIVKMLASGELFTIRKCELFCLQTPHVALSYNHAVLQPCTVTKKGHVCAPSTLVYLHSLVVGQEVPWPADTTIVSFTPSMKKNRKGGRMLLEATATSSLVTVVLRQGHFESFAVLVLETSWQFLRKGTRAVPLTKKAALPLSEKGGPTPMRTVQKNRSLMATVTFKTLHWVIRNLLWSRRRMVTLGW